MKNLIKTRRKSQLYWLLGITLALVFLFSALPAVIIADQPVSEEEAVEPASQPDLPSEEPSKTTAVTGPNIAMTLESCSQKLTLDAPAGALEQEAQIEIIEHGGWQDTPTGKRRVFEFNAYPVKVGDDGKTKVDTTQKITRFSKDITVIIQLDAKDLAGMDPATLKFKQFNEDTLEWEIVPTVYNRAKKKLTGSISHFSNGSVNINTIFSGPGMIQSFQVGMHTGAAVASFPIALPPGRGGQQPSIALTYSSDTPNNMKDKTDVGSWVGIGWTLDLGNVRYDEELDTYFFCTNGVNYELVEVAPGDPELRFRTSPESFYKITATEDGDNNKLGWDVYDTEGNLYSYGYDDDARQLYWEDTGSPTYVEHCYRWDVSEIEYAASGQRVTIDYQQDYVEETGNVWPEWIRSAYPEKIAYNYEDNDTGTDPGVEIFFDISPDCANPHAPDQGLRADNPVATSDNSIPRVMETRMLDDIIIQVNEQNETKYHFDYTTTSHPAPFHDDVEDEWVCYAGTHQLDKITTYGWDGAWNEHPATMDFTYVQNTGCPGDQDYLMRFINDVYPACYWAFEWPYLSKVENGYGAITTYTYDEKPDNNISLYDEKWTRQIVETKTVDPGSPSDLFSPIVTSYTYQGADGELPYYSGTPNPPLDVQYRGYYKVTEVTDGNKTEHFYWVWDPGDDDILRGNEYNTVYYEGTMDKLFQRHIYWGYTTHSVGEVDVPITFIDHTIDTVDPDGNYKYIQTDYGYDSFYNVDVEQHFGLHNPGTSADNYTIFRDFYPVDGTTQTPTRNIIRKPVYEYIMDEDGDIVSWANYYYDGVNHAPICPTSGNLTRIKQKIQSSPQKWAITDFEYDDYGNLVSQIDPRGNITNWTYNYSGTNMAVFPESMALPNGMTESYVYDLATGNLESITDANLETTSYEYDEFGRLTTVNLPGLLVAETYDYSNWPGTSIDQQYIQTETKDDSSGDGTFWVREYLDGLERPIQMQAEEDTGVKTVSSTAYDSRGMVFREYLPEESTSATDYTVTPSGQFTEYSYDGLGRIVSGTMPGSRNIRHEYEVPYLSTLGVWKDTVTNEGGYENVYYYDAYGQLIQVDEIDGVNTYTTTYTYDALGNLIEVEDALGNTATMEYDMASRKISMDDPDMGNWDYEYDANGNLVKQTDSEDRNIYFKYDSLDRLTHKFYGSGVVIVSGILYEYDDTSDENEGQGQLTHTSYIDGPLADTDDDGIPDIYDNCPQIANTDQSDINNNGIGDACDGNVEIYVDLQGSRPNPEQWEVPITVGFFTPGADVLNDTPQYEFSGTASAVSTISGTRAYFACPEYVAPSTYDITADSTTTLLNVKRSVYIE